jgi:hypothetical protein
MTLADLIKADGQARVEVFNRVTLQSGRRIRTCGRMTPIVSAHQQTTIPLKTGKNEAFQPVSFVGLFQEILPIAKTKTIGWRPVLAARRTSFRLYSSFSRKCT